MVKLKGLALQSNLREAWARWYRDSATAQRWPAIALLDNEPRLRMIKRYHDLPILRRALKEEIRPRAKEVALRKTEIAIPFHLGRTLTRIDGN